VRAERAEPRRSVAIVVGALAWVTVFCSVVELDERFGGNPPSLIRAVDDVIGPLHIIGGYGLFAVMTTTRHEIVLEGSNDGTEWREYEFPDKPGDVTRAPPWNIPNQPRLDWQMWFAALDDPRRVRWFPHFLERVLRNEPAVMALLEKNPFPEKPPVFVRARFYDYTFASSEEKARGVWWDRRLLGAYFPASRLK
jgi:lipase maturation factor 1